MVEAAQARQGYQTGIRRWSWLDRASIGRVFGQRVVSLLNESWTRSSGATQQHNTHITDVREICYPWHP
jgi:hypothetical protein